MNFEEAKEQWLSLASYKGAAYDKEVTIDINELSPVVTWGTNPALSLEVDDVVPEATDKTSEKALEYVKLKPGESIEGTPVDYVFIGSCTNARISDLREAANIFKDKRVHQNVTVYVVLAQKR